MKQLSKSGRGQSIWITPDGYVVCDRNERPRKRFNRTYKTFDEAEQMFRFLVKMDNCKTFEEQMDVLYRTL